MRQERKTKEEGDEGREGETKRKMEKGTQRIFSSKRKATKKNVTQKQKDIIKVKKKKVIGRGRKGMEGGEG